MGQRAHDENFDHRGFETYGGGILVVVEGDAAIAGVSGPQRGVSPGWLPMLLLAEA